MSRYHTYTREKLLNTACMLVRVYGESLSLTAFRRETGLSQHLIFDLCGSWTQLRIDIGLTPEAPRARPKLNIDQIKQALRTAVDEHGPNLSEARFCRLTGISPGMIARRCGSWSQLRQSIGLSPRATMGQQYTDLQVMEDLFQVICRCRRFPPFHQYKRLGGKIAAETIRDRYGSWPLTQNAFENYLTQILNFPPLKYYEPAQDHWLLSA